MEGEENGKEDGQQSDDQTGEGPSEGRLSGAPSCISEAPQSLATSEEGERGWKVQEERNSSAFESAERGKRAQDMLATAIEKQVTRARLHSRVCS